MYTAPKRIATRLVQGETLILQGQNEGFNRIFYFLEKSKF